SVWSPWIPPGFGSTASVVHYARVPLGRQVNNTSGSQEPGGRSPCYQYFVGARGLKAKGSRDGGPTAESDPSALPARRAFRRRGIWSRGGRGQDPLAGAPRQAPRRGLRVPCPSAIWRLAGRRGRALRSRQG